MRVSVLRSNISLPGRVTSDRLRQPTHGDAPAGQGFLPYGKDSAFFSETMSLLFPELHSWGKTEKKKNLSNFNFCNTKIKRFGITEAASSWDKLVEEVVKQ